MRVAHVVRQFPPSVGGLEEAVLKLGGALKARGFDIEVVTLDRIAKGGPDRLPASAVVDGLPVRRIPFRGSWRYPVAPGVLRAIRDADVVHVHGIDFFFDFLALTATWHRKPLVASTHGGFFHTAFAQRAKQVYFATVTRTSARAYRAICASSRSDHALFAPIAGDRLVLAPNGVDIEKWAGLAAPQARRHMVYIGRFSSNKNLPALFPVLRTLRAINPEWRLTVAGSPWDVSGDKLRSEAARVGVAASVTIMEQPSDAAIADVVRTASYITSPSRHEGFGLSIVEGLSAGLVPVLSRIAAFAALVEDGGLGLLVDFASPDRAAQAIERQHQALQRAPADYHRAATRAAQRYSWAASADAIERAYASALHGAGSSHAMLPARTTP